MSACALKRDALIVQEAQSRAAGGLALGPMEILRRHLGVYAVVLAHSHVNCRQVLVMLLVKKKGEHCNNMIITENNSGAAILLSVGDGASPCSLIPH